MGSDTCMCVCVLSVYVHVCTHAYVCVLTDSHQIHYMNSKLICGPNETLTENFGYKSLTRCL